MEYHQPRLESKRGHSGGRVPKWSRKFASDINTANTGVTRNPLSHHLSATSPSPAIGPPFYGKTRCEVTAPTSKLAPPTLPT
eukprot:3985206-Amphidinium_carterae.1